MVEKRTTATKDGILGGQVPSVRWPAMGRVTAARCPGHAPSYKPVSCWQSSCFPRIEIGVLAKKKKVKPKGFRHPITSGQCKD
jgi:hypothetical protein